jgi:hypothetical protein
MRAKRRPSRRQIRAIALACFAAGGSLAAVPSSDSDVTAARSASAPKCATSQLVVWIDLPGNGTAGSTYYTLQFTNLSSHKCTLRGYPGVSAVDLAGHQLGAGAGRNNLQTLGTVVLPRGETKTAVLRVTDPGVLPAAECRQTVAAGIRVYPPGQTSARIVPFPVPACSRKDRGNIATSPVGRFRDGE